MSPRMVLNWRRTSSTMASAALPTDFIVMALNQYGSMAPTSRPQNSCTTQGTNESAVKQQQKVR